MTKGKIVSRLGIFFFMMLNIISCIKNDVRNTSAVTTDACSGTPGPLFTAVKSLVTSKCVSCHNNIIANGGMNFTIECNIVTNQAMIKLKAVDEGSMPPTGSLSQADKSTITNWISAGGRYTD